MESRTPALSGTFTAFSPVDVVGLLHETRKSGCLQAGSPGAQKSLFFLDGEVVFAASSLPYDRLGESLVRSGRITPKQLEQAAAQLKPGIKLGRILVDLGTLTPGKLWIGVKNQVEEIFYSVVKMEEGGFVFFEEKPRLENIVRLSRSVRSLILEGVRQMDELKIFVEKIINQQTVFMVLNRPSDVRLTDVEEEIFGMVDGKKDVRGLIAESTLSPFVTLKVLSNLMQSKLIFPKDLLGAMMKSSAPLEKAAPSRVDDLAPERLLLQRYNRAYSEIYKTLEDVGHDVQKDLAEYLDGVDSPFAPVAKSVRWQPPGVLDEDLLLSGLTSTETAERLELVGPMLEDFLFFLLFKSQELLPRGIYELLMKSVEELQRDIRS